MKLNNRSGYYYSNSLIFSEAFQSLTIGSRNLLHILICELRYTSPKLKNGRRKIWTNNGEVSCTETEFRKITGCCSSTYIKSRNQLIKVGFIEQTYRGGTHRGDRSKYKINVSSDGLQKNDEKWRDYPNKDWEHNIPRAKKNLVGKNTQWKKGQSGRKI